MALFFPRLITVDPKETLRYAGMKKDTALPEKLVEEACNQALLLARPQAVWSIYSYDHKSSVILSPQPLSLDANSIVRHLKQATAVAVLAVTIGSDLEEQAERCFTAGQYTLGLLLDAAGATAVETAADIVSDLIKQQSARQGLTTLPRFSPGYGNWRLTIQPEMLAAAGGQQIGLHATESCMLVPRKSITALIGLIPAKGFDESCQDKSHNCALCTQVNCLARKEQ